MIWVQWDLHGGFKMKAVGPQRIQKCSQNSISPKKENANKFLRFSLCNICLNNCVCLSRRNGKNAPGWCATVFWGGEMANSCAAEIGQARLLGKTGSASKAESACELCVFMGIQKICGKIPKYKITW